MSQCERARAAISLCLDGELSQLEHAFLERHLGRCGPCRAFHAECAAFTRQLRRTPLHQPARPARNVTYRRPSRRRRVPSAVVAVASSVAVALAGLYGFDRTDPSVIITDPPPVSGRAAYLESAEYELGLMRPVVHATRGTNDRVAI